MDIYTSFNLTRVKRVRNAHSTFITGLEFLSSSDTAAVVRGFREASVVSISVDHQVSASVCSANIFCPVNNIFCVVSRCVSTTCRSCRR